MGGGGCISALAVGGPGQTDLCPQVCRARSPRSSSGACFAQQCYKPRSQRCSHRPVSDSAMAPPRLTRQGTAASRRRWLWPRLLNALGNRVLEKQALKSPMSLEDRQFHWPPESWPPNPERPRCVPVCLQAKLSPVCLRDLNHISIISTKAGVFSSSLIFLILINFSSLPLNLSLQFKSSSSGAKIVNISEGF